MCLKFLSIKKIIKKNLVSAIDNKNMFHVLRKTILDLNFETQILKNGNNTKSFNNSVIYRTYLNWVELEDKNVKKVFFVLQN